MSEAKDELLKTLTHSKRLGEVELNLETSPLKCGFPTIEYYEYLLAGEGNMVIISAKPGHGKTALSSQIALNVAEHGRVLYFSLEMAARALKKRLLAVTSGVPIKKLTEHNFKQRVDKGVEVMSRLKLDIIDDKDLTIKDIISKTYDENSKEKLALVVIDYIGIISYSNDRRHEGVADAAKRIKDEIADKLKIPAIVLAQMKSGFDERYNRAKMEYEKAKQYPTGANRKILEIRPTLEDVGESSGIAKAADVVMFLNRPCLLDPEEPENVFKVYVAKNRNGEAKDFDLEFSSSLTKFVDRGVL
jgi:replicative DNA helicase